MQPLHIAMSWEEFRDFPRQLGWKHEYYDGKIHVTPAHLVVTLVVPLTPREVPDDLTIRPVEAGDEQRMLPVFLESFADSMDYADCTPDELDKSAARYFKGYFGSVRGQRL